MLSTLFYFLQSLFPPPRSSFNLCLVLPLTCLVFPHLPVLFHLSLLPPSHTQTHSLPSPTSFNLLHSTSSFIQHLLTFLLHLYSLSSPASYLCSRFSASSLTQTSQHNLLLFSQGLFPLTLLCSSLLLCSLISQSVILTHTYASTSTYVFQHQYTSAIAPASHHLLLTPSYPPTPHNQF